MNSKFNKPIDLVYLWVNGNDEHWKKEKIYWQNKLGLTVKDGVNDCRFIDNQELKYSLRSVMKNAPWINKIFIVTNGQVPDWLDISHPKIKLITHEEIMPKEALPTFNSEAIETCLCNIPGLSEYFLYANDDMFINCPITPDYFFDRHGKPIVRLVKENWSQEDIETNLYLKNIRYSISLIKSVYGKEYRYEPSHNIDAYRKSYIKECIDNYKEQFIETQNKKFRTSNSVQRIIYSLYMVLVKHCKLKLVNIRVENHCQENTYIVVSFKNKMKNILLKCKPKLFCINDEEWVDPEYRLSLKYFLAELYPECQQWEIRKDYYIEPINKENNANVIVFAPDNNYCKYFSVALYSLIVNSSASEQYDLIVLSSDISIRNKNLLLQMLPSNFSLRFFNIDEFINDKFIDINLKPKNNWSKSMYYRIFIPFIMYKYKKVLYCDSDICFNNNLTELFNINCEGKQLLAVIDTVTPILYRKKDRIKYMKHVLNLSNCENYFNSGVLMFNLEKIEIEKYLSRVFDAFKLGDLLLYPDQDILNMIFENHTKFISSKWNYMYGECAFNPGFVNMISGEYQKDFLVARQKLCIVHYTSPKKPWISPKEEFAEIFWHYARQTPFYEEIIYENTIGNNFIKETKYTLTNLNMKRRIYFNYYRSKILSYITFGKIREHYKFKRLQLKNRVRNIRYYSKL